MSPSECNRETSCPEEKIKCNSSLGPCSILLLTIPKALIISVIFGQHLGGLWMFVVLCLMFMIAY